MWYFHLHSTPCSKCPLQELVGMYSTMHFFPLADLLGQLNTRSHLIQNFSPTLKVPLCNRNMFSFGVYLRVFTCISFLQSCPPPSIFWGCSFVVSQACWEQWKSGSLYCQKDRMLPFPQEHGLGEGKIIEVDGGWWSPSVSVTLTVPGRKDYYWKALKNTLQLFQKGFHILKKFSMLCGKVCVILTFSVDAVRQTNAKEEVF